MVKTIRHWMFLLAALASVTASAESGETALVTALDGAVTKVAPGHPQVLQAFAKLKFGDLLALDQVAKVQVVYMESGRQETWTGTGRLEITKAGGLGHGLAEPQVKTLPLVMVRQIAKTPSLDSQGRTGMLRLRSVATARDIAKVEESYKQMRAEADANDLNPELYLLSSMFEMRELDRVDEVLQDLQQNHAGNQQAGLLVSLYKKAVKNARESQSK